MILAKDNGQIAVVESGYFGMLLDFLEHAELPPEEAEDEEEKKQFEEAEKSISKIAIYATSTGDGAMYILPPAKLTVCSFRRCKNERTVQ